MKKIVFILVAFMCVVSACGRKNTAESKPTDPAKAAEAPGDAEQTEPSEAAITNGEPVYLHNVLAGWFVCEFAENGTDKDEQLKYVLPYVQKGRLYFICPAIAPAGGNLKRGFEFQLWDDTYTIRGKYQGNENFPVKAGITKNPVEAMSKENEPWVVAAGYAELGKIIVTRVFLDNDAAETFAKTVKTLNVW